MAVPVKTLKTAGFWTPRVYNRYGLPQTTIFSYPSLKVLAQEPRKALDSRAEKKKCKQTIEEDPEKKNL